MNGISHSSHFAISTHNDTSPQKPYSHIPTTTNQHELGEDNNPKIIESVNQQHINKTQPGVPNNIGGDPQ